MMEKLLEDISFHAEERGGTTLIVDAAYVDAQLAGVARDTDLSKYVL
jgi:ATP-dependent HslUV protease ATP-binding subunit HslU